MKTHPTLKILLVQAFRSFTQNGTYDFAEDNLSNNERTVVNAKPPSAGNTSYLDAL
jgi:hypothetical protein